MPLHQMRILLSEHTEVMNLSSLARSWSNRTGGVRRNQPAALLMLHTQGNREDCHDL